MCPLSKVLGHWLFPYPVSGQERWGIPFPAALSPPGPGFLLPSRSARWVPASGPAAKGGVTQHRSPRPERGGTGEGLGALLRLEPLSPPCSLVSARSRRVHAGRTTPVLRSQQGCTFPCREHPGVCQAHTSAVQNPKQHPKTSTTPHFCILSRISKRLRWTHHGLLFPAGVAVPVPTAAAAKPDRKSVV